MLLAKNLNNFFPGNTSFFHTTAFTPKKDIYKKFGKKGNWLDYNKAILSPPDNKDDDKARYAEFCHERRNIKYSAEKLWYPAKMIRGMSIDEAIKQLTFIQYYGAKVIREVLLEAQDLATKNHFFEFKSNMWIAESFCTKALMIKGMRKQARGRASIVKYRYCHYFVRLLEGQPPDLYYPKLAEGFEQIKKYMDIHRNQNIDHAL